MRIGHEFMNESVTAATVAIDISNLNLLLGRKMMKDRDFRTTFIVLGIKYSWNIFIRYRLDTILRKKFNIS